MLTLVENCLQICVQGVKAASLIPQALNVFNQALFDTFPKVLLGLEVGVFSLQTIDKTLSLDKVLGSLLSTKFLSAGILEQGRIAFLNLAIVVFQHIKVSLQKFRTL